MTLTETTEAIEEEQKHQLEKSINAEDWHAGMAFGMHAVMQNLNPHLDRLRRLDARTNPSQKFLPGQRVYISGMRDNFGNKYGTVIGSYADQYSGKNVSDYTVDIDGIGDVSWFHEKDLTLIQ